MTRKPWYRSKTLWFNLLMAAGTTLEASLSVIQGEMRPYVFLTLTIVTAVGNAFLRFISTSKLTR